MLSRLKDTLNELRHAEPGQRFQAFHDKQQELSPRWTRPLYLAGAFVSFAVGVVLVFIPGPAVVFFALTGALLATQSAWLAKKLDAAEVKGRKLWPFKKKQKPEDPDATQPGKKRPAMRAPLRRERISSTL
jgi:hypothetical protein